MLYIAAVYIFTIKYYMVYTIILKIPVMAAYVLKLMRFNAFVVTEKRLKRYLYISNIYGFNLYVCHAVLGITSVQFS